MAARWIAQEGAVFVGGAEATSPRGWLTGLSQSRLLDAHIPSSAALAQLCFGMRKR